jgi:hypothetical protein
MTRRLRPGLTRGLGPGLTRGLEPGLTRGLGPGVTRELGPGVTRGFEPSMACRAGPLAGVGRALLAVLALTGRRAAATRGMGLRVSVLGGQSRRAAGQSEGQKRPRDRQAPKANHDPKAVRAH